MAIITLNNNSLSNISSLPAGVGGKVLQVVSNTFNTPSTTTSSSYVDTGISLSITPSSSSSKIVIMFTDWIRHQFGNSTPYMGGNYCITRNTTVLWEGDPTTNEKLGLYHYGVANNFNLKWNFAGSYTDNPSTTSSTTYKTQHKFTFGTAGYIETQAHNGIASMTLMEIAG